MGQELRSIVLSDSEFTVAVGLHLDQQDALPVGSADLEATEVTGEPDAHCLVKLRNPMADGRHEFILPSEQLVEIFVLFCKMKAVPLPRNGKKTVIRRDDAVVLEILIDWF